MPLPHSGGSEAIVTPLGEGKHRRDQTHLLSNNNREYSSAQEELLAEMNDLRDQIKRFEIKVRTNESFIFWATIGLWHGVSDRCNVCQMTRFKLFFVPLPYLSSLLPA